MEPQQPLSPLERLMKRLGDGASASLQREMLMPENLNPRLTLSKILSYALATSVFIGAFALLAVGILSVLSGSPLLILVGVALIGLAFLARPQFTRIPSDGLDPTEAPRLFSAVTRIAQEVGTKPPDIIRLDASFNAWVHNAGWRRVRVLTIGVPLFATLDTQEQVAILGHEFAHFTNGDPRRSAIPGAAVETLVRWHATLRPRSLMDVEDERLPGLIALPINIVMGVLSLFPYALAYLLLALMSRESQRGEYIADAEGARLAGTAAMRTALDKLHLEPLVARVAGATSDEHWANRNLWDELRRHMARIPAEEFERMRADDRESSARLAVTHPPTASRLDVLASRTNEAPRMVLGPVDAEGIEAELRTHMQRIQRDLIDDYSDGLLRGDTLAEEDMITVRHPRPNEPTNDWLM